MESQSVTYKSLEKNLGEGLSEVGKGIKGLPHVIIGSKNEDKPIFSPKKQKIIDKIKEWALIVIIVLVVIYSIWQIIF